MVPLLNTPRRNQGQIYMEDLFLEIAVFLGQKMEKTGIPWIRNEKNKNYSGSAERFNDLAMLFIENKIAISIDFENILQDFAKKKSRRVFF